MAARACPIPHHPLLRTLVPLAASHPIRTASHSSLHSLVAFSLAHLSSPSAPPLVLHTLPPPPPPPGDAPDAPTRPLDAAVAALPKLVSLHQLVLRASPAPLHSYTRLDSFERHHLADSAPRTTTDAAEEHEQLRQDLVALEWLSGRAGSSRRPRRKHTPLLVIVVSPVPLSLPASFTHQPPQPLSRSAKRALKRPAPAPPPPAAAAAAPRTGTGAAAPAPRGPAGDESDERAGAGGAVDEGAGDGGDEPARKRRRRRRGKGKGKGGGAGAAGNGAGKGEGEGAGEDEGGKARGMDVDAAPGA